MSAPAERLGRATALWAKVSMAIGVARVYAEQNGEHAMAANLRTANCEIAEAINELQCCDDVVLSNGMAAAIGGLRKQRDQAQADAARYRLLVESGSYSPGMFKTCPLGLRTAGSPCTKAELDAHLDGLAAAKEQA